MNAQTSSMPVQLRQVLKAARVRTATADEALAAAQADLDRKRAIAAQYETAAREVTSAIEANESLEQADTLADRQRVAEVRSKAAQNMVRSSTTARDLAQAEVEAAQRVVNDVARQILLIEVQAKHTQYVKALAQFTALRESLLAAWQGAGREALTPLQWLALDRPCFNVEELGGESPEMHVRVDELHGMQEWLVGEDRCLAARARIEQHLASWEARLEALSRGAVDSDPASPEASA